MDHLHVQIKVNKWNWKDIVNSNNYRTSIEDFQVGQAALHVQKSNEPKECPTGNINLHPHTL